MNNTLAPLSDLFVSISSPARLEILLIIGSGESCVCYLEARLGYRQAYISQHLMALRQAGVLESRREGKYVFYRLAKPEITPLIQMAAEIAGVHLPEFALISPQAQCHFSIEATDLISSGYQESNS